MNITKTPYETCLTFLYSSRLDDTGRIQDRWLQVRLNQALHSRHYNKQKRKRKFLYWKLETCDQECFKKRKTLRVAAGCWTTQNILMKRNITRFKLIHILLYLKKLENEEWFNLVITYDWGWLYIRSMN